MTDAPSPFDDPEFAAMLKQHGVVHRPGLADEMMQDIGPLLAADGYDMDNLDEDVDIDQLNEAMDRAVERRNMELVTPVGQARDRTINTLREVAVAFHSARPGAVEKIVGKLRRDPTMSRPSVGHLTGVAMETLDAWHSDKKLRAVLNRISFKNMPSAVKGLAPNLKALARKRRACGSLDSLIMKNNGRIVADAGAYLVAASVVTLAENRAESFEQVLDEMLPGTKVSDGFAQESVFAQGSAFGQAAVEQVSSQGYVNQFGAWLAEQEDETGIEADDIELLESFFNAAHQGGLDPHDPDDFGHWIDFVMMVDGSPNVDIGLALLQQYVSFRMQLDDDPEAWDDPHEMVTATMSDLPGPPRELLAVLEAAEQIPAEQRHQAINELPVISGILKLRDWLGKSQPITGTAVPKRADIETVAAMIGLDAQGVARLADATPQPDHAKVLRFMASEHEDPAEFDLPEVPDAESKQTVYVRSALDLPELMAWWRTLEKLEIILLTSTRVQISPWAHEILASDTVPLEDAEGIVASFVRELFIRRLGQSPFELPAVGHAITRIVASMVDEPEELVALDDDFETELIEIVSRQHLQLLAAMGLLELKDGEPSVPENLRAPMVYGLLMTMEYIAAYADFAETQEPGPL